MEIDWRRMMHAPHLPLQALSRAARHDTARQIAQVRRSALRTTPSGSGRRLRCKRVTRISISFDYFHRHCVCFAERQQYLKLVLRQENGMLILTGSRDMN